MMRFLPHAASEESFNEMMRKIEKLNDELAYVNPKYERQDQRTLDRKTDEFFRDFTSFWSNK